jgi:UDP-N-acetylglucosamine 2-epimerase (non-hydrolysing)
MKKIISIVGARPNFIKIAPLHKASKKYNKDIKHLICHTGQHFDENMSRIFFDQLGLPEPEFYLGIGGGSHAEQTGKIMMKLEQILMKQKPDLVVVPGDVNSTMAATLTASKLNIPVGHVESGLRSFDRFMPEELNRIVTDVIADMLFVSEPSGLENLKKEGIADERVFYVGNIMIDSLVSFLPLINKSGVLESMKLETGEYILVTLHRPRNVDSKDNLSGIIHLLNQLSEKKIIIFPIHPRTRSRIEEFGLSDSISENVKLSDPIGYIDFLALTKNAGLIVTDSGGIQEESTYLGVQCVTARDNTERPVTVDIGTNHLAGTDPEKILEISLSVLNGNKKEGKIPELWDGKTAQRIMEIIHKYLH